MSIKEVEAWMVAANPDVNVQAGVHFEEVGEMLETMDGVDAQTQLLIDEARNANHKLGNHLKDHGGKFVCNNRKEMLDAICDQLVTATGVGAKLEMQVSEGLNRVNASNWSKFVDGKPIFKPNGKVDKGPNYVKANLEGLY